MIYFDGYCVMCSTFVQFLIRVDKKKRLSYISQNLSPNETPETIIVTIADKTFHKSDAVLKILPQLTWYWFWVKVFFIIPKPLRDKMYDWIARNRYKWFGKRNSCFIPPANSD